MFAVARDAADFVLRATGLTDAAELCTLSLPNAGLVIISAENARTQQLRTGALCVVVPVRCLSLEALAGVQ